MDRTYSALHPQTVLPCCPPLPKRKRDQCLMLPWVHRTGAVMECFLGCLGPGGGGGLHAAHLGAVHWVRALLGLVSHKAWEHGNTVGAVCSRRWACASGLHRVDVWVLAPDAHRPGKWVPPPPCISYAKVPNQYGPYAYCSLNTGVACAAHRTTDSGRPCSKREDCMVSWRKQG